MITRDPVPVKIQKFISFLLVIFLPLLITFQVILRYVFVAPLMGVEELMMFPIIWLYFLGGANASYERNHIECGILILYMKTPRAYNRFRLLRSIISVLISIWMTYWAFWLFVYSIQTFKYSDLLSIPMIIGESALFIGLVLMTVYTLFETKDYFKLVLNEKEGEGHVDNRSA